MMKKSRILCLMLALALVLASLAGCGTDSGNDNAPADTGAAVTDAENLGNEDNGDPYTIAVVVKITGIAWYERMQVGIDKFNEETGNDAYITGAATADAAEQVAIIEDLIAQGVDALVVIPNSVEAVEPVLARAREAGIVVITHEASDIENADYDLEAFNNQAYGEFLMETLAGLMGGEGTYTTFLGYLTATSHNEWVDAEVAYQTENYPGMNVVSNKNETSENSDTAYQKTQELLRTYPELSGFIGSAMADIPGVARAVEEAGLEDSTYVVGTCLVSTAEQYLETGAIDVVTFWDPADAGYALCELATMVLDGEEISDGISLTPDGYQDLTLNGKVFEGSAWLSATVDNMDEYDF